MEDNDRKQYSIEGYVWAYIIITILVFALIVFAIIYGTHRVVDYVRVGEAKPVIETMENKYGTDFKLIENLGAIYEQEEEFISHNKTGYSHFYVVKKDALDSPIYVKYKDDTKEIVQEDYIESRIMYNTAKIIESDYKIGDKMYVYIGMNTDRELNIEGAENDSFFTVENGEGQANIYIFYHGDANQEEQYLESLISNFKIPETVKGQIRLIKVNSKEGIDKVRKYYKENYLPIDIGINVKSDIKDKYIEKSFKSGYNGNKFIKY